MHHLRKNHQFPEDGFRIKIPIERMASMILSFYIGNVLKRGRNFQMSDELENSIWEVSQALTEPSYRFGIVLSGGCGNGKTTMLYAIRDAIHYLYSNYIKLFADYREFNSSIPVVSAKEIACQILEERKYYSVNDILMIDDLGHEPTEFMIYGTVHTPIIDLLERRYDRHKYTIISTNLAMDEIRPKYRNRIADRFNEMMHFIRFESGSFRE